MNNELLAMLDYLERDRGLNREVLTHAIEEALESAARKAVGPANGLRVHLDPKTGDIQAVAQLKVVERVVDPHAEIAFTRARTRYPEADVGEEIEWEVTPRNFGRIAAQTAKQGIMQRLRQAEKERVRDEYADRVGEVLYGNITRFEKGDVILSVGRAEAVMPYPERVPNEDYQIGDHLCGVLLAVDSERQGPSLVISRSHPMLVQRLFEREVAEIAEHIVEIRAVARESGYRSKIAVHSTDDRVDPVGACVGVRGSRVKNIVRELNGEKVDIVRWDPEIRTYVANALQPAKIKALKIDEDEHEIKAIVESDQLSLAIGKRGQNARLSVKLTGWHIDIQKAEEAGEAAFEEKIREAVTKLASAAGINETNASQLVHNGFLTVEGIAEADEADIASIEGIGPETAKEIKAAVAAIGN